MIENIEAHIELGRRVGLVDSSGAICPTGERFETFVASAILQKGQADDLYDSDLVKLLVALVNKRFLNDGTVYWRKRPVFETTNDGEDKKRHLRCRLFISDKPALIVATEIQYEVVQTDLHGLTSMERRLKLTLNGRETAFLTLNDLLDMMNCGVRNGMVSAVAKCQR